MLDKKPKTTLGLGLVILTCGQLLYCSQAPPPIVEPEIAVPDQPSTLDFGPREVQPTVAEEAPPPDAKPYGEKLVVIESGEQTVEKTVSLVEAAQQEKLRRQVTEKSQIVITDQNLQTFATGELTFTEETFKENAAPGSDRETDSSSAAALSKESEERWRARLLDLRLRLRDNSLSIKTLEDEVAQWRQRFYLEEDNYHRDSQVKPAWDRAQEELALARSQVEVLERQIAEALDEGRQAGIPPGWLREGIEFEPRKTEEADEEEYLDPGEPVILDESSGGPR
jgi:hypothetical protein